MSLLVKIYPFSHAYSVSPHIPISETSQTAALSGVTVSGSELKNAQGDLTGITLQGPDKPVDLSPGANGALELHFSQRPDPGSYTARLAVRAPGLKQSQPVDVTVKVRVLPFFLLVTIGCGIALGWVFNVSLANRAALDAARLDALRAADALAGRAAAQKDPAAQQRLLAIASALEDGIRNARDVKPLQDSVSAAQVQATQVEASAKDAAAALVADLSATRTLFLPNGTPPDDAIANLLASITGEFQLIDSAAASGDVEAVQARLTQFEQTLPRRVMGGLLPWLASANQALDELGPWASPAQTLEQARSAVQADIQGAYGLRAPNQMIQQTDSVARKLRSMIVLIAPRDMTAAFRAAATVLRQGGLPDVADSIPQELGALSGLGSGTDLLEALSALATVRRKVESTLRAADPGRGDLDAALTRGDFPGAATLVVPAAQREVAVAPAALLPALPPLTRVASLLPSVAVLPVMPRVILPSVLKVAENNRIRLDWADASDQSVPDWTSDPLAAATFSPPDVTGVDVRPREAGFFSIIATFRPGIPIRVSAFAGKVEDSQVYIKIAAEASRVNKTIAVGSAVLTLFLGYEIFVASWFGTVSGCFGAFVWGFFGQFSLDRVRELARPLTSKALP
jgi:hypothetical protein